MAFIWTTTEGLTVSITSYSVDKSAVYISSKEDHGLGNSFAGGDYPYYVDVYYNPVGGEVHTNKIYIAGNYIAHLVEFGTVVDYSEFILSPLPLELTINSLDLTSFITPDSRTLVRWVITATGSGEYRIYVDDVIEWGSHNYPGQTTSDIYDLVPGSHEIGVQPTNNPGNRINKIIIVPQIPPPGCETIAVDTWKPVTTNPKTGQNVPVTVKSGNPNSHFLLYIDKGVLGYENVIDATTDGTGCYTGEIPAQADGSYAIKLCYPVLGVCINSFSPYTITWGTKPMSWEVIGLIAIGILGAAYVLGKKVGK